ncbi:hypothetical protein [Streptomyces sp. SID5614]|uniref:hypothetical protein n=1 Tax=Streptomyces sp. SID5614 TaxID=2690306 RepID=UPI0013699228|nr:hypothetical protein [Streptomyces sp. SID5614]MZG02458.1 hypothetical protein [Streptomyces sp. SID5614]
MTERDGRRALPPHQPPRSCRGAAAARFSKGATVFDWLVEIFHDEVPGALLLR